MESSRARTHSTTLQHGQKLTACQRAQHEWRHVTIADRGHVLHRVASLLEERASDLAHTMAREMGKPLAQGHSEIRKCALVCRYYATNASELLQPQLIESDAARSGIRYDPLGTVLAIMPWNFPFWQVFRFSAPALMAGNAVALKHAPNVPDCAQAVLDLFTEADLPSGLFANLRASHDTIEALIGHEVIEAVTFTGSTRAGAIVAGLAGKHLKKTVLELGGSDPFVVLADADVEEAARVGCASRLLNAGQSCIAAKRFIVERAVAERFSTALLAQLDKAVVGDPMAPNTTVGPLAREDLRDTLHQQVCESVNGGARLLRGGVLPSVPGGSAPVTLITDVAPGMPAWSDELFGPVAVVRVVENENEALSAANDTLFGLGGAVFTSDPERADRWCKDLEAGAVFINGMVKSDPRLPFGGIRRSGYGRELGALGIREFVNQKTFWVAHPPKH